MSAGICYCDLQEHKMCYIQKYGVQIGVRGIIYIWKRLPVRGQVQFILISVNDVVTPRFSRCMLIVSRLQLLTELYYMPNIRESARGNYRMRIGLEDFFGIGPKFVST